MPKTALVLEGGSLRGIFTAGILDRMLQKQIRFDYVIGTSAGALNAMNYISGQIGRTARIDMTYVNDKRFIGMRQLISHRSIFNFKFLFGEISHELIPFDYKTFYENPAVFDIVTTSMITGQPVYFRKGECNVDLAVQASSSLPLLSQPVYIEDDLYMDGGCSMPIAYKRALDLGYDRIVVILTRDKEYQKQPVSSAKRKIYETFYRKFPEFLQTLSDVPQRYNEMTADINRLEEEGKLFVIRPDRPIDVSRVEKNLTKLATGYYQGRETFDAVYEKLKEYLYAEI